MTSKKSCRSHPARDPDSLTQFGRSHTVAPCKVLEALDCGRAPCNDHRLEKVVFGFKLQFAGACRPLRPTWLRCSPFHGCTVGKARCIPSKSRRVSLSGCRLRT